jgi:hypothetical protein
MLVTSIDEDGGGTTVDVVEASASERIAPSARSTTGGETGLGLQLLQVFQILPQEPIRPRIAKIPCIFPG